MVGIFDTSNAIELGAQLSVRHLLLGSAGELFGQLILTIRLVSAEAGTVVFSKVDYGPVESWIDVTSRLARSVTEAIVDLSRDISVDLIQEQIDDGQLVRAQQLLDAYIRINGLNDTALSLREQIKPGLFEDYMRLANRSRRQQDYQTALQHANAAIAIKPSSDAYELRERILREQREYDAQRAYIERQAALRLEREQQRIAAGGASFVEILHGYYAALSATGHRAGAIAQWTSSSVPQLPTRWESFGLHYAGVFSLASPEDGPVSARPVGYVDVRAAYGPVLGGEAIDVSLVLAPHSAITLRLLNVFVTAGVHGGVNVRFSDLIPEGYALNALVGLAAMVDLRFSSRLGLYGAAQVGTLWDDGFALDSWLTSASAGLVLR
jgi:hypothetical protein